jgi:GNAT superfamily N-acetyltransferase
MSTGSPITIRPALPADASAIARAHVASWQTSYRGMLKAEILAGLSIERRAQGWLKQLEAPPPGNFLHLAEQDGKVLGFASGGPERTNDPHYTGEIYGLYLLQAYQRQGIGRKLVEASVTSLLANGMSNMIIWVLRENPARKFYEALGGQYLRETEIEIQGQILMEVAYGWNDLHTLVKNHA